ncbi:MAG: hypothetical protein IKV48_08025 [Eggerthellaceae bacterium]|nr:hypothetical protein [Eggerthellaceae bacterium]
MENENPLVKTVYKPVIRKQATSAAPQDGSRETKDAKPRDPFRRAANEDDDGYDPYSDRPADPVPLFERDPWS